MKKINLSSSSMRGRRVLVAGGSGFIGKYLVERLIRLGADRIFVLCRNCQPNSEISFVTYLPCDLARKDSLNVVKKLGKLDYVFNLTGRTDQAIHPKDPRAILESNLVSLINLTEVIGWGDAKGAVHVGSNAEYGNATLPHREDGELKHTNFYGLTKAAASNYAIFSANRGISKWAVARPFFVCGKGQPAGFIAELAKTLKAGKNFTVNSAEATRDAVLVEDVAEALTRLALSKKARGRAVNICSGQETSMGEIALKAREIIGRGNVVLKNKGRPGDFIRSCGSTDRLKRLTGWKPTRKLAEVLNLTLR